MLFEPTDPIAACCLFVTRTSRLFHVSVRVPEMKMCSRFFAFTASFPNEWSACRVTTPATRCCSSQTRTLSLLTSLHHKKKKEASRFRNKAGNKPPPQFKTPFGDISEHGSAVRAHQCLNLDVVEARVRTELVFPDPPILFLARDEKVGISMIPCVCVEEWPPSTEDWISGVIKWKSWRSGTGSACRCVGRPSDEGSCFGQMFWMFWGRTCEDACAKELMGIKVGSRWRLG